MGLPHVENNETTNGEQTKDKLEHVVGLVEMFLQITQLLTCYAPEVGSAIVRRVAFGHSVEYVASTRLFILATLKNRLLLLYNLARASLLFSMRVYLVIRHAVTLPDDEP